MRRRRILSRVLARESGQMAIFVALIFQVLFVFFAMIINIGLLIHDKINLQNAVDLGAYYAAQRQSEVLNYIAHINYQIRQNYKLMAFRQRVLGAMGHPQHPFRSPQNHMVDQEWDPPNAPRSICVSNSWWQETAVTGATENLCNATVTPITVFNPPQNVAGGINPWINPLLNSIQQARTGIIDRCNSAGIHNFIFASMILSVFREDQSIRRRMIEELAQNLSLSVTDFRDLRNQSVRAGVVSTIRHNLTDANREAEIQIEMLNGLGLPQCNSPDKWLSSILIMPVLRYADFQFSGNTCHTYDKSHTDPVFNTAELQNQDPSGFYWSIARGEPVENSQKMHSSLGIEKNPWCMSYVGVRAQTAPRKPFAPFGQPVTLEARAFAQPFGGRIGPWAQKTWPFGANASQGDPTDPLAVPRIQGGAGAQASYRNVPNYSRFPGDTLGLRSRLSLAAASPVLYNYLDRPMPQLSLNYFLRTGGIEMGSGDSLAWADPTGNNPNAPAPMVRTVESAMIAPDLFDITYYSVEPRSYRNYLEQTEPLFQYVRPIGDLGSRREPQDFREFSVEDQITNITNHGGLLNFPIGNLFYMVKDSQHVLTSWAPAAAADYSFPSEVFGRCSARPIEGRPNPGNCVVGGRTGYSIRHISQDYIQYNQHAFGGEGVTAAPILNRLPADWQ